MVAYNKFNLTVQDMANALDNFSSDALKIMLTNTAPVATNHLYTDVSGTELASGNGYTTGGATVSGTGDSNASGVESIAGSAVVWTSVTGTMGPFRYAILYDSTSGKLLGWWDYGSSISLNGVNGDTFAATPAGSVLFTIT